MPKPTKNKPKNKPKNTNKSKPSPAKPDAHKTPAAAPSKTPAKPIVSSPAKRKIGERTETITERLSLGQIEDERKKACELMRTKEQLVEKKKAAGSEFKSKIDDVDARMKEHLSAAANGTRTVEIVVEEWLTDKNQVQRYRLDTGELLGDRIASVAELQEKLDLGDDPELPDDEEDEEEPDAGEKPHVDGPPPDDATILDATVKDSVDAGDGFGGD